MKNLALLFFIILSFLNQGITQFPEYFEFLDQENRNQSVTSLHPVDQGLLYTANTNDGMTNLIHIDENGLMNKLYSIYGNHFKVKLYDLGNDERYFHFLDFFDCDYHPPGSVIVKLSNANIDTIIWIGDSWPDIDACVTNENGIHVLNVLNRDLPQILRYNLSDFSFIDYLDVGHKMEKIFSYRNRIYIVNEWNELVDVYADNTLLAIQGKIQNIKQEENKLVIFANQISIYDLEVKDLIHQFDYDLDNTHLPYMTFPISICLLDSALIYAGKESEFYKIDFNIGLPRIVYEDQYPNLSSTGIIKINGYFLSAYSFRGYSVIRKTPELKDYNYDRVDLALQNPKFHSFTTGTSINKKYFMERDVEVSNEGEDTINDLTLHSFRYDEIGWDCGYEYLKDSIDLELLPNQVEYFEGVNEYDPQHFDFAYFFLPGANYKLDNDPSNNFVSAPFTTDVEESQIAEIEVFPNPVQDVLNVSFGYREVYGITIVNSLGQVVYQNDEPINGKMNICKIETDPFESGLYFLMIQSDSVSFTTSFFKQ